MKDLIDLVQIVTKPKIRSAELLGIGRDEGSKLQEFYDLINQGELQEEDGLAYSLYHTDKQSPVYQKLRKNLRDRLVNYLFIIDQSHASYTDRQRAYYECCKDWAATKILFVRNANSAAISLARKVLKFARKYEFTELLMDINNQLRLYYGTIEGDYGRYQQYNEDFKLFEKRWQEEMLAQELYIELSIGGVNSKSTQLDTQAKAQQYFERIKPSLDTNDSYLLHLCGRLIEASIYSSVNDYENLIGVCERGIASFEKKDYTAAIPLQVFYYQLVICFLQLRNFVAARDALKQCLKYLNEGDFNWFKAYETYFMLHMHTEEYVDAFEIFQMVINHPKYKDMPGNIHETWKISEAYLFLLSEMGKTSNPHSTLERNFRLARFFNEIQIFSKDKSGMNVPILILEILFNLVQHNFDALIDREEAIDKYRKRYLKDEELLRSNTFLKMLLQFPRCNFDKAKILSRTNKDLQVLHSIPIELANQIFEIEIIPYEKLWEYMLELLD